MNPDQIEMTELLRRELDAQFGPTVIKGPEPAWMTDIRLAQRQIDQARVASRSLRLCDRRASRFGPADQSSTSPE